MALAPNLAPFVIERVTAENRRTLISPQWPPTFSEEGLALVVAQSDSPTAFTVALRRSSAVPLVIVTTSDWSERLSALEQGADLCLSSSEQPRVVAAHLVALLRRQQRSPVSQPRIELGNTVLETESRSLSVDGVEVAVSRREFDLLAHLMRRPNRVFRRHELLAAIWGPRFVGESNTVAVHIAWLRQKLPKEASVRVTTLRGVGYRLDVLG